MATYEDDPSASAGRPQFALPRLTPVVKRLLILNGVIWGIFCVMWFTEQGADGPRYRETLSWLGLSRVRWIDWAPAEPVWQLLSYGFLHSVSDPMHILINMLMLYFFGTLLEERLGGRRFFLTYMASQLVGGIFFLVPALFGVTGAPAIGASGAVYGVMIAMAALYPRMTVYFILVPIPLKWLAIGFVGIAAFLALREFKVGSDGTAHLIHLGGAAYAFLAVRTGLIEKDPVEILERRRAVAKVERAADDEARMDRLLDKIHKDGMASLTRSEKEFLKRMSSRR
jgi:membrane associated rhomboid family serine protease